MIGLLEVIVIVGDLLLQRGVDLNYRPWARAISTRVHFFPIMNRMEADAVPRSPIISFIFSASSWKLIRS